ncbi:CDP-glycerol glycerophosphotransferase family protein [Streptomyces sp. NBC_01361]|uniref:CDP-glycerol glycerophosphotransferase family protein n=1 Tax=Streptomyces sp. NBC_01361 TaxID=2903838 RepID=UPI002E2FC261|nr:CDP-glycerol glycerophosphotransferase family protein [Streptomyces sp. NBC_01361]
MTPRLSVVVPIYNVEAYLDACLESLAAQTMPDLEVVMVDDGSTDGSPVIARAMAAHDRRFRYVGQENAGLGAARNAGAALATGAHLAFVDSDDVVPHDAYERMLGALEESGSDFVTGNVHRLRPDGVSEQSPMFRKVMGADRSGTHVTRDWGLLADRVAWNKVFRRAFWDRHALAFPEGVLFEDTPVMVPAHFLADAVDVLKDPVYLWRDRDGSITNRRAEPRAVRDRTSAVLAASGFLAGKERESVGTPAQELWAEAKRRYDTTVVSGDMWLFMEVLPHGDAEYHEAFLDHANSFADTVDPAVLAGLPLALRVKWQLIRERRLTELLAFMTYEKSNGTTFVARGPRRRRAQFPPVTGPLPRGVTALRKADLPLKSHITEASWDEDGRLRLKGFAYVRNLPAGRVEARAKFAWLRAGKRRAVPLKVRTVRSREATYRSKQGLHSYDRSGFETAIDPARLVTKRPSTVWNVEMAAFGGGLLRTGPVRMGGLAELPVRYLDDFLRITPRLSKGRLRLRAERVKARLVRHEESDGTLRLEGELAPGAPADLTALRVKNWHTKEAYDLPVQRSGRAFTAELRLNLIADTGTDDTGAPRETDPWGVGLVRGDGRWSALAVRPDTPAGRHPLGAGRELLVLANAAGNVELRNQTVRPLVDTLTWKEDGRLAVGGSFPEESETAWELLLQHSGHDEEAVLPVEVSGGRFDAALCPDAVAGPAGVLPLAEGRWYLFLREPGESDPGRYRQVHVAPARHESLPLVRALGGREFSVGRRSYDRLVIGSGSGLAVTERGGAQQGALRTRYASLRVEPRTDTVLYSSFDGRQYSDSPRAVHEELVARGEPLEHLWVVRDQQVAVPASCRPVALWSTEWYEALARSRYVVTNTQLPDWFERAEDQYVVQTWHGTPLKRIGRDLADSPSGDRRYIATLPERAAQWNLLVSPNRFSTPVLRGALGYHGDVLESGYPRNDLLHAADRAKVAAAVRERLGIPEGRRVVLYAPTWRENQPRRGGRYGLDLRLDLAAAERALGEDHVLLVRRHYLVGGTVPRTASGFVRDVTRHPDVGELLLISDVLVTDYSSLMFDFAQTGRPMLFHTYDLDHYRDTLRGFYFDFVAQAPGPLLTTGEEVVEALRDPAAATAGHEDAYRRFREVFCDLDDGRAAAHVADAMLPGGRR